MQLEYQSVSPRIFSIWIALYDSFGVAGDWQEERARALESAISDLRAAHPSVPVGVEVHHQWAAQALVDESETASMLVLGRHVLREARSPVMIVPLVKPADDWGFDAEDVSPQT